MTDIENWLRTVPAPVITELNENETNTAARIAEYKDVANKIREKEKTLIDIKQQCNNLTEFKDISPLAGVLTEQLTITIEILRKQLTITIQQIEILETYLKQLREQPVSARSEAGSTIGSSPMPEYEVPLEKKGYEAETQTSVSLQAPKPTAAIDEEQQTSFPLEKATVETLDTSVQTAKEKKPTENILVTQTFSDAHETIKFESAPNLVVPEKAEDVFVDAKYQQPGDPTRTSELILRNIPQSFETTFVEPDETTTEVVVDADGTKRIIVRKLIRTRQQSVQQHHQQQFTTISSLVNPEDSTPVSQSITQVNVENQSSSTTVSDAGGTKTVSSQQAKGSLATGNTPDNLVIQEVFETQPQIEELISGNQPVLTQSTPSVAIEKIPTEAVVIQPGGVEQSSIRTVVQQVTRRVIRRTRKVIKRVVIIDGKEHITEEVVEEPEEIELTEDETPQVNVNIIRTINGQIVSQEQQGEPIVQFPPDVQTILAESITTAQPITEILQEQQQPEILKETPLNQGKENQETQEKQEEEEVKIKEDKDSQVLEFESAPVDLVIEHAPDNNVAPVEITNVQLTETIIEQQPEIREQIVNTENKQPEIINIQEIWPHNQPTNTVDLEQVTRSPIEEINIIETVIKPDTIASDDIWPTSPETGTPFELQKYKFETKTIAPQEIQQTAEVINPEQPQNVQETVIIQEETLPPVPSQQIADQPKPAIDIRAATQMFIDNELNTSDSTTRTIKVSLPAKGTQSPGNVTVKMAVEPKEQATINVNITEELAADQTKSDASKRKKKNKKKKPKEKTPTPEEPISLDPSVVESVELNIEDDNTISEKLQMPEFESVPTDDQFKTEQQVVISPDESYASISEKDEPVKIVEEAVLSSPSEEVKTIAKEIVITTNIVETKNIEDAEQQTTPLPELTQEQIWITENPVLTFRSSQTSPEPQPQVAQVSQQTSPEPSSAVQVDISEAQVQTSPLPETKPSVEITSEGVQTDAVEPLKLADTSMQTVQIESKEQELQTSPRDDVKIEEIVTSADVIPPVVETMITEIVRDIPVQIQSINEATNTELVPTTENITQTVDQQPIADKEDVSVSTTSSEPYEIHVKTTLIVPEESISDIQSGEPIVMEVNKSFVIDENKPYEIHEVATREDDTSDKRKKKKSKKKKGKGKETELAEVDLKNETSRFLESEQYAKSSKNLDEDVKVKEIVKAVKVIETKVEKDRTKTPEPTRPQTVQIQITKTTNIYEPIILPAEKDEDIQLSASETIEPRISEAELVDSSSTSEPNLVQGISSEPEQPIDVVDTSSAEKREEPTKPTLIQLEIKRTTVYDSMNLENSASKPDISETEISEVFEDKTPSQKKTRPQHSTSVRIEEVLSPTEEIDVPLTPGSDRAEEYERAPQTIWNANLITNRPTTSSEEFIISESSQHARPIPAVEQIADAEWYHTNDVITDRIRNTNNLRNAHLSNVLHLATLSEVITEEPMESRIRQVEENLDNLRQAIETRNIVIIQKTVITVIETISTWLQTVEYRVYLTRQDSSEGPSEDKVKELNDLTNEIQVINEEVSKLTDHLAQTGDMINPNEKERMATCFDHLKEQVQAVHTVTKDNSEQATQDLQRWNEYIIVIKQITIYITNLEERFEAISLADIPIEEKLKQFDELEDQNRAQLKEMSKILQTARGLSRDFPHKQLPVDVYKSYEEARALENAINLERSRLLQLQSLADEYDQTLHEFAQIISLAETLVLQPISASTLDQLQQEMQKHRTFFIHLSHCRSILESLEENIDVDSKAKHSDLHKSLYDRASNILERASERAQKISLAASRWTVLEKGMKDESHWLQVAQQRVPDLSQVTSADYEGYIPLYQSLAAEISNHHAKILQLTTIATQLQELVNAPHLEEENNDSLIALLNLRDKVTLYLRRLSTFKEIWNTYEILTDRLEIWIKDAERELGSIEVPKDLRTQPIENMRQFWEIKVHHEVSNNVRNDIANNLENAIEVLPIADETLQRQFHGQLENRWSTVSQKINGIQNAIINSLSDQEIPINEKLALLERELKELQLNLTSIKSVIKNEEELNLYIERMQVLNTRISVICNELGRIGMLPSTEPEQIGELFALSHRISSQVAEELENATLLKDRLVAIQDGIKNIQKQQKDSSATLDDCENNQKLGSDQVQAAIIDCEHVGNELSRQWQEIMNLRQLLHTLPTRLRVSVSPVKLERDLSHLQDEHAVLESRCGNILKLLHNRFQLWRRFERQLEIVQQSVHETDYMVELLKINGQVDYERLRKATERLEVNKYLHFFFKLYNLFFFVHFLYIKTSSG